MIIKHKQPRQLMFRLTDELKVQFKTALARRGSTVQEFCETAINDFVKVAADEESVVVRSGNNRTGGN